MLKFELPMVHAATSIDNAIKTVIDARTSGLLVKTKTGDFRLVHYKGLVSAAAKNKRSIGLADYVPVAKVGKKSIQKQEEVIEAAGLLVGVIGTGAADASLFSLRETFAGRYVVASAGRRCEKPGKPANTQDRDWYHYYPPLRRSAGNPAKCRICGSKIS